MAFLAVNVFRGKRKVATCPMLRFTESRSGFKFLYRLMKPVLDSPKVYESQSRLTYSNTPLFYARRHLFDVLESRSNFLTVHSC